MEVKNAGYCRVVTHEFAHSLRTMFLFCSLLKKFSNNVILGHIITNCSVITIKSLLGLCKRKMWFSSLLSRLLTNNIWQEWLLSKREEVVSSPVGIVPTSPLSEPEPTLPFGLSLSEPTYLHLPTF